jgi:RNA polymerase sigma factor (sigma-70 family)
MNDTTNRPVPTQTIQLHALSSRQRRLVERHLPLIGLTVRRHFRVDRRRLSERHDLHQVGCLALADAIKSHDPDRHGDFPTFAMARIHVAVSRYKHEDALVRVPYITQRRRRIAARNQEGDRHRPDRAPRTHLLTDRQLGFFSPQNQAAAHLDTHTDPSRSSLGDIVRDCCDTALQEIVSIRSKSLHSSDDPGLMRRCADERWSIPDSEYQATYRQLAHEFNCPHSRIARREKQVMRDVRERLLRNHRYLAAIKLARTQRAGLRYVPTAQELAAIESMNNTG